MLPGTSTSTIVPVPIWSTTVQHFTYDIVLLVCEILRIFVVTAFQYQVVRVLQMYQHVRRSIYARELKCDTVLSMEYASRGQIYWIVFEARRTATKSD
jgi:hypothetical protein